MAKEKSKKRKAQIEIYEVRERFGISKEYSKEIHYGLKIDGKRVPLGFYRLGGDEEKNARAYAKDIAKSMLKEGVTDYDIQNGRLRTGWEGIHAEQIIPEEVEEVFTEELEKRLKHKGLEDKLPSLISMILFGGGLFFLSSNITGNVVGNFTQGNSNLIGVILFCLGLIGGFFYLKKK